MKNSFRTLKSFLKRDYLYLSRMFNGKEEKIQPAFLDEFIDRMRKTYDVRGLGEWFSWNYVSFQFMYWNKSSFKFKTGGVVFPVMVFDGNALQRWKDKKENWKYSVDKFLDEYQLTSPPDFASMNLSSLWEKERLENSESGNYLDCIADGLYSDESSACGSCKYNELCSVQK